jgi:hypothetical protein
MQGQQKTSHEIIEWLNQEYAEPFAGWDFAYLKGRWEPEGKPPWDYAETVNGYLNSAASLLDVDTGGGEVLAGLLAASGFSGPICALEAYAPNVPVARKQLASFGARVLDISEQAAKLEDDAFDLVIDRHGGSLSPEEIFRVLKLGGHYITEQIGEQTNRELRDLFNCDQVLMADRSHNADEASQVFRSLGFTIDKIAEHLDHVRFLDAGALVYYLKAVPWEVPGFTIQENSEGLVQLHRSSLELGFAVDATYHTYLLVARK